MGDGSVVTWGSPQYGGHSASANGFRVWGLGLWGFGGFITVQVKSFGGYSAVVGLWGCS